MFSLDTLKLPLRAVIPGAIATALFLLLLEIGFRLLSPFNYYGGWENSGLQKKMDGLEQTFREKGRIDVLLLSTSVGRPIDVRQFEEATGGRIVCYNAGHPEQRPERQRFLFEKYYWPRFKPSHILYGVAPPDVNSGSRGMHPDAPQAGPFFEFEMIRRLRADSPMSKVRVALEDASALFAARRRIRTTIQLGEIPHQEPDATVGRGVQVPTPRRQPYGPLVRSWTHMAGYGHLNAYKNYWVPENGEFGELLKLARLCEAQGVKFVVVEVPTSPYAHTNFDNPTEDYKKFTGMLDWLTSNGVTVLPMAQQLKLDNTLYEDMEHLNRWGGQVVTNYIYENVITRWFPDLILAPELPQPREVELWRQVSQPPPRGVEVRRLFPENPDAQYSAPRQVLVQQAPVDLPVDEQLPPGSYSFELYAGDGTTTAPEQAGDAVVSLLGEEARTSNSIVLNVPLDKWRNTRLGISYTQYLFNAPTTTTLQLRVSQVAQRPLILDSVYLRRRLSSTGSGFALD